VRIASYNVENLFERAIALSDRNWKQGRPALEAYARINTLLNKATYTKEDKTEIRKLLRKLGLAKKDDGGTYAQLRQNRGRLLVRRKVANGTRLDIVANGRADWVGWVELKTEPVNQLATQHVAMVMRDIGADVLAVVEADNRISLNKFSAILLKAIEGVPYPHVMLIDGNDDRGIDVGLLTKAKYQITRIRSHVDDADNKGTVFSRDCPEYTVAVPGGEHVIVLVNHFKSKGHGSQKSSNERRERQARRVAKIYKNLISQGEKNVAVVGDLNDFPTSKPLVPLLNNTNLKDITEHPNFTNDGRPGTFQNGTARQKIDYLLLSPALFAKVKSGGIFRKGVWGGKNGTLFPHYATIKAPIEAASDHAAIYADLNLS
jgi:endonuclease/exonuclease/phosphatase family metal-dependent hydrolase